MTTPDDRPTMPNTAVSNGDGAQAKILETRADTTIPRDLKTSAQSALNGAPDDNPSAQQPPGKKGHHFFNRNQYMTALVATAPIVPICAMILAVTFYLNDLNLLGWRIGDRFANPARNSVDVLMAAVLALVLWLLFSLWYQRFTTIFRANVSAYRNLRVEADRLEARLHMGLDKLAQRPAQKIAFHQARSYLERISDQIDSRSGALRWVNAAGYVTLWKLIHRADEALFIFDDSADVVAEARYDELRLKDSSIDASDDLLVLLRNALTGLDERVFAGAAPPEPPVTEEKARAILSKVRRSINEFRDGGREGLVQARNHLLTAVLVTGIATDVFLSMIIIASSPSDPGRVRESIVSAVMIFAVGAIVGLFSRLYLAAKVNDAVEDFGLETARLVGTPLFSGLAAVGGVLITIFLPGTLGDALSMSATATPTATTVVSRSATPPSAVGGTITVTATPISGTATLPVGIASPTSVGATLSASDSARVTASGSSTQRESISLGGIFNIGAHPFELVIAAIFGLTPGLLISRLQKQSEGYKDALSSTEASQNDPRRSR